MPNHCDKYIIYNYLLMLDCYIFNFICVQIYVHVPIGTEVCVAVFLVY